MDLAGVWKASSVLKLNVWGCTLTWLFSHCVQSLESEGGPYDMVSYQSEM